MKSKMINKIVGLLLPAAILFANPLPVAAQTASISISNLPPGGTIQSTDILPVTRSGVTYKVNVGTAATQSTSSFLLGVNNLSDIGSVTSARVNLGLGTSATFPSTAFLQAANNLSDIGSASAARTSLGLGSSALLPSTAFLQPSNNLSDVSNAIAALTNILPSQTGQAGNALITNGTTASWAPVTGTGTVSTTGTPASGNLAKFSGSSSITNGDLSGDCTTNGTLVIGCTKTGGVSFSPSATTDTTNASNILSGTLPAARLPNPTGASLGGTQSIAAVSHNFLTSISTSGVPALAQPAASDISGLAPSATTDTTNAANIGSGTLPAARLPNPSATTLGGIQSTTGAAHNFITSISTLGVPAFAQPAFTDISGSVAAAQLPNPTTSTLGGVQAIVAVAHNWITSITTSGVPVLAQPACADISNAGTGCSAVAGYVNTISTVTGDTTVGAAANTNYFVKANCSAPCTITLPTAVGNTDIYTVKRTGSAVVTVAFTGGQTADGASAIAENVQFESKGFFSDTANFNIIN